MGIPWSADQNKPNWKHKKSVSCFLLVSWSDKTSAAHCLAILSFPLENNTFWSHSILRRVAIEAARDKWTLIEHLMSQTLSARVMQFARLAGDSIFWSLFSPAAVSCVSAKGPQNLQSSPRNSNQLVSSSTLKKSYKAGKVPAGIAQRLLYIYCCWYVLFGRLFSVFSTAVGICPKERTKEFSMEQRFEAFWKCFRQLWAAARDWLTGVGQHAGQPHFRCAFSFSSRCPCGPRRGCTFGPDHCSGEETPTVKLQLYVLYVFFPLFFACSSPWGQNVTRKPVERSSGILWGPRLCTFYEIHQEWRRAMKVITFGVAMSRMIQLFRK